MCMLGCTEAEWQQYLVKGYNEKYNTNFENMEQLQSEVVHYQIDEIVCCDKHNFLEPWDELFCWNFRNSQLLYGFENQEKGTKDVISEEEKGLMHKEIRAYWSTNKSECTL